MHNTVYRLVNTVVAITPTLVTALPTANVYVRRLALSATAFATPCVCKKHVNLFN